MTEVYDHANDDTGLAQPSKAAFTVAAVAVCLALSAGALGVARTDVIAPLNSSGKIESVDSKTVLVGGEFAKANLGTRVAANGQVTTRIVATPSAFSPSCVVAPAGRPIDIRMVSSDGIHSVLVTGAAVAATVAPGAVSEVRAVFKTSGDLLMMCDAICGMGQRQMVGTIRVVPPEQFRPGPDGRASC